MPNYLEMSDDEFNMEVQILLAVKLCELGMITAGIASQIAGVGRIDFLSSLVNYSVTAINIKDEEVAYEIESSKKLAKK